MWNKVLCLLTTFNCVTYLGCQFFDCHDDPAFEPREGTLTELQFTWLGALQYIHVKKGSPHYFRVPRVVLISKNFVLSTAVDAAEVPDGYALGNIVFGEYERDETECRVTINEIATGAECEPAVLLMPIADVLLHPEYKHFGLRHSLALLKLLTPVKSKYMVPVCLPFRNYITRRDGKQTTEKLYHLDFGSDVPRDFIDEEKEITKLQILPNKLCYSDDDDKNLSTIAWDRIICSNGCDFHSGAPTIVHEQTGHWSVVAIAQGGSPCPDPLRPRRSPPPPKHVLLHPYVPWITAAITDKPVGAFEQDDPFGFIVPRVFPPGLQNYGWVGHWWMGGIRCYNRAEAADDLFRFYHEIFQIQPSIETDMTYYVQIDAAHSAMIVCVKVGMPYQLGNPRIWDLNTPSIKLRIPLLKFRTKYRIEVEAWAKNYTDTDVDDNSSGAG